MAIDDGIRAIQSLPDMKDIGQKVEACEQTRREIRAYVARQECKFHPGTGAVALCSAGPICGICVEQRKTNGTDSGG